jgi:hypothetical protein
VPHISGSSDEEFWNRLVLQATHHEPAIRHAAIALGSLYERFSLSDDCLSDIDGRSKDENFALQQYVKALGFLLEPMKGEGKQAVDVALMNSVLFICFEVLRLATLTLQSTFPRFRILMRSSRLYEVITVQR